LPLACAEDAVEITKPPKLSLARFQVFDEVEPRTIPRGLTEKFMDEQVSAN
jgi:hypothetical protein